MIRFSKLLGPQKEWEAGIRKRQSATLFNCFDHIGENNLATTTIWNESFRFMQALRNSSKHTLAAVGGGTIYKFQPEPSAKIVSFR